MKAQKPLSPAAALRNELRTLERAQDKVVGDAAKEDRRLIRSYNAGRKKLDQQLRKLDADFNQKTRILNRNVDRTLKNISSRIAKLNSRLAAL
jgi:hypothetical protein